jgi:citrate lyase subunit beta/citryl-CoA lyase
MYFRSKLFVPGSRPDLFEKALGSGADAVSFDLEDAVSEALKARARDDVAAFIRRVDGQHSKTVIVRVNGLRSGLFLQDAEALLGCGADCINVPKVESADEIRSAADATGEIPILANIETPKGLRQAAEIACAHPAVAALQIGLIDLFCATGVDPADPVAAPMVRLQVRLAAAEAGIPAYDSAFATIKRLDLLRSEAEAGRRAGLAGKSCIHPSQIAIVNEVFAPSPEELERAQAILAAAETGSGAVTLNGSLVDKPIVDQALEILSLAKRLALFHDTPDCTVSTP